MSESNLGTRRPTKSADFMVEELDGETLLYSPTRKRVARLNESGRLIWELCDGKRTLEEITEVIAATYPESAEQVRSDILETFQKFLDEGLVT